MTLFCVAPLQVAWVSGRRTMGARLIHHTVPARHGLQSMTVTNLKQCFDQNDKVVLIDVRDQNEIESMGKIKGAINVPFHVAKEQPELFSAVLSDMDKNAKTVFHCVSGRRSEKAASKAVELGFQNVFNLRGGMTQWAAEALPIQAFGDNHSPWVHTLFEPETETAQYIVTDLDTREAYIIDPVLDYDPFSAKVYPQTAKKILDFVAKYKLSVSKIIDTHVHADHLTAAHYLQTELDGKPKLWMGNNVTQVQETFGKRYNLPSADLHATGEQFDHLVRNGDTWKLGNRIQCQAISTPGHTQACMSYRIGDAAFVGDTLFMPDIGTARCDFPGGSIEQMYESIQKMYTTWPDDTRVFVGHDYPPANSGRSYEVVTSLGTHKRDNIMIRPDTTLEEYQTKRAARDKVLRAPRYIHPSLQTNLRGGHLPSPEKSVHGDDGPAGRFFKIPLRWQG